jgi:hypothetical protein
MNHLSFELGKIFHRRLSLITFFATIFLFPVLIKAFTHMMVVKTQIPEGLFANNVASVVILFSQSYTFIPVWMLLLAGLEFTSGHVNRVAFMKSRGYYFMSKLAFTAIVTLLFSVLGIIAFMISTETSPFRDFHAPFTFYLQFLAQLFLVSLAYSALLLCLIFWLRSPIIAFVIYFAWNTVESIGFTLFQKLYHTELTWLPFHLINTLYLRNGESGISNDYYNPLAESPTSVVAPLAMVAVILFFTYKIFIRRDLKPLSD